MVRLPKNLSNTLSFKTGVIRTGASVLEAELLGEKAYSLGLAAKAVETSLAKLESFHGNKADRLKTVQISADAVHAYFVQRELMGFTDHDHPITHFGIPNEVLAKVGVK